MVELTIYGSGFWCLGFRVPDHGDLERIGAGV